jgi:hypothetical protein
MSAIGTGILREGEPIIGSNHGTGVAGTRLSMLRCGTDYLRSTRVMLKTITSAAAALALTASPALAAPSAPVAASVNPAASLSVAPAVRAGSVARRGDKLAGGGIFVAVIAAVLVIGGLIIVANDDDNSDSN